MSRARRTAIILASAAILVGSCGEDDAAVVADQGATGTLAETPAVRAMAIIQGREYAVQECQANAGIPTDRRYRPVVDLIGEPPPIPGFGLATSLDPAVGRELADNAVRASVAQESNSHALEALPQARRKAWKDCRDRWLGDDALGSDAALHAGLGELFESARSAALASPDVTSAYMAWSECVRESTALDAEYPWDLRKQMEERWTDVLADAELEDQLALDGRAADFAEFENDVRAADDQCHAVHVADKWDIAFAAALADATATGAGAATVAAIEETRPPYETWLDTEQELAEHIVE